MADPWEDDELQHVYDHLTEPNALEILRPLIPSRSDAAINCKLHQVRREAGLEPVRRGPRAITEEAEARASAEQASREIAERIQTADEALAAKVERELLRGSRR